MDALCSSETADDFQLTTARLVQLIEVLLYKPEGCVFISHRRH
jgi:hypothetical protein